MLSRQEAAELMLRSSLRSSSEFHDAARARSNASRDAPSPEVTAANRRADEAERAAFAIEEEAAERGRARRRPRARPRRA